MSLYEKLPKDLKYLAAHAEEYGRHQYDEQIGEFLDRATENDMAQLAEVAERYRANDHATLLGKFLDQYPITDHDESARLYFLFGVIDAAGIDLSDPNWNTIESHMESLRRFGSFRLASERMHATKFLADFGVDAGPAIPLLQQCRTNGDYRVRVWSNYALFRVDAEKNEFIEDIRAYLNNIEPDVRTEAASALGALGKRATTAIPELIELIKKRDEDEYDKAIYMESLVAIGNNSPIVIDTLLNAAKSDVELIRDGAKECLAELGVDT